MDDISLWGTKSLDLTKVGDVPIMIQTIYSALPTLQGSPKQFAEIDTKKLSIFRIFKNLKKIIADLSKEIIKKTKITSRFLMDSTNKLLDMFKNNETMMNALKIVIGIILGQIINVFMTDNKKGNNYMDKIKDVIDNAKKYITDLGQTDLSSLFSWFDKSWLNIDSLLKKISYPMEQIGGLYPDDAQSILMKLNNNIKNRQYFSTIPIYSQFSIYLENDSTELVSLINKIKNLLLGQNIRLNDKTDNLVNSNIALYNNINNDLTQQINQYMINKLLYNSDNQHVLLLMKQNNKYEDKLIKMAQCMLNVCMTGPIYQKN